MQNGGAPVEKLFSTDNVHPRDRFDYWHSVACEHLVTHHSRPECRGSFAAELEAGSLIGIGLVLFMNSPMTVSHTTRHIAHARDDDLFICRQVAGRLAVEQERREVVLDAGAMTLLDPMMPYRAKFGSGSKMLVLKIPRRSLQARVGRTREMVARSVAPAAGASLVSSFVDLLPTHADKLSVREKAVVENLTLDLLAISLAGMMDSEPARLSSARAVTLVNVHTAVEARLSDPTLDAKSAAAAAGVSLRYANAVLAQEDTSVARLIRSRRLARCASALRDPHQACRSVSEIAYGWGFSDMTHFGRSFKKAYGVPPKDYRRVAIQRDKP
jgi:AraC family transcriptional activator of tynA and feaB